MSGPGIVIVGLGPAGLDRLPAVVLDLLMEPDRVVVARTVTHPAAAELAQRRRVVGCDDLYDGAAAFDDVYGAIVDRVLDAAAEGPTAYAVPGSALVGERAVRLIQAKAAASGRAVQIHPGESFLDLAIAAVDVDPIGDGLQVVDGRALPDPLPLHAPTLITQVDTALVAADVAVSLGRVLPDSFRVVVLDRLGADDQEIVSLPISGLAERRFGPRTTLFVPAAAAGWHGLVQTNRRLRAECPWDREQTHHSLLGHLIEEAYEAVDAISHLSADAPQGAPDLGAYAVVEEELGDLLLQVVFHATLAAEAGAFDVEEVAEGIRRKLVHRHPHVFADVEVDGAADVLANWESLKRAEKGRESLMDDVPAALPGIARADKQQRRAATVGFDWPSVDPVFDKVMEELGELRRAEDREDRLGELGDLLFAVVNLARHLGADPEAALARANDKFATRFRAMESEAAAAGRGLADMTPAEMDAVWERVKRVT